ncbi:DUF1214 domain-containing protein [Denitratisoma oestradiolicum]|uniref:DUF1214 domain-containing protein n=1 Tax=Denitratisoma oestradiolicum TaxID=311182 RepID=A0A6S6Y2G8_9PROT|nr:DUF1214 domain-containing protein [Denitratisoma oestradiolicum]TWO79035.1 hypothetical protein CBW56_16790 [Denitratisoma oestradiolicum]CAB1369406.1 conserved protein of unknown function [Denitratisoma oestradiolicum]
MQDDDIEKLTAAWDAFCDDLKAAGRIPLRPDIPDHPLDRAAGFQQLMRNISLAWQFHYEYRDPLFPELARYFDPTRKQGGDNSDCVYVGAQINGTDTYRIRGDRGSARYFSVVAVETGATPWGGRVANVLFGHQIETAPDGSFELWIGPEPRPGNWLPTTPDTFRITFRQYFADWETERPMRAQIDRVSTQLPAPLLSPAALARGLTDSIRWLRDSIEYWPEMLARWKPYRNQFLSYWQLEKNRIDATPGGDPLVCYWELPPDQALIIRVMPPEECVYWGVEFGNTWWETMDYRYRLSNTNMHYAVREDDGELIVVVSHEDPGVPNWLDCSGFAAGYVTFRWMLSEQQPIPQVTQIPLDELHQRLPPGVKHISPAERIEQLAIRRRGVTRRFGY